MRLVLIDGNFFLYHACYGARARLRRKSPTQGQLVVRGTAVFWSILQSIVRQTEPTHLIVTFDGTESTFRHQLDERYKSRRRERPPEMPLLKRAVHQLLKERGVFFFIAHGVEADDVMGTFARLAVRDGYQVIVCTGDNDLAQLVQPGVQLWLVRAGRISHPTIIRDDNFHEHYPVAPDQIPDWKALLGDRSDTIPGVPRMTYATAQRLLRQYGHIPSILAAQDLDRHARRLVKEHRAQIERNLILAQIRTDVDLFANWQRFAVSRINLSQPLPTSPARAERKRAQRQVRPQA